MSTPEDFAKRLPVLRLAQSAAAVCQSRFTTEGTRAPAGTPNPYKPGSAAATWWQRGHDQQQMQSRMRYWSASKLARELAFSDTSEPAWCQALEAERARRYGSAKEAA